MTKKLRRGYGKGIIRTSEQVAKRDAQINARTKEGNNFRNNLSYIGEKNDYRN